MSALSATPRVNAAVARAKDLPELIASLPPGMAAQLESKPLLASKTPWGTLAVAAVAWVSARYGFGWDETTCSLIGGVAVVAGAYAMRLLTSQPIAGVVSTPAGTPPAVEPTAPVLITPQG